MVAATEKPVQWVTLQKLRDERNRTRPAWETTELDGVLADGHLPVFSQDAHRHQVVANELPSDDRAAVEPAQPGAWNRKTARAARDPE
jgi:hypothetical protein